jgi:hypothetical protein
MPRPDRVIQERVPKRMLGAWLDLRLLPIYFHLFPFISMTAPPFFVFIPCDFLPYAPVGSRILGPCVTVLISSLRMYYRSPCVLPRVVLICFTLRTRYTVSYIACTVIYLVPQSEYRLFSHPFDLVHPLRFCPLSFGFPLDTSVLPRAGLAKQAPRLTVILSGSPSPCPSITLLVPSG